VASVCRDLTVDDRCGERFLDDCQAAAIHRAALGWLTAEGRFFSLCHSGPVRTPSAEPSLPGPASWHRPRWNLSVSPEVEPALALARRLRSGPTTS
jgi:hypothetical protein